MKAIYFEQHGTPEVLLYTDSFPTPKINDDEVLVRIKATSVNPLDTVIRRGYPGLAMPMPHIPGGDIAGEISEIGSSVKNFAVGDRVIAYPVIYPEKRDPIYAGSEFLNNGWKFFGMHTKGSYAEFIAVPYECLIKLPENISYEQAAALPIAGLTAYHAAIGVGGLRPDDTFMLWGGSGGLGTIAIQLAKLVGAEVITTTSDMKKAEKLKALGADHVFNHKDNDVLEQIKEKFPSGLDVILDYVGPDTFDKSFALLRKNGKMLFCGMLSGREVTLNIQQFYFRHLNFHGLYLGSKSEFIKLLKLVEDGKIKPVIDTVMPLAKARKAHELYHSGNFTGKIVLSAE